MFKTFLILQIFIVLCLVVLILLQKSDRDGFSSGGGNRFLSNKSSNSFVFRLTMIFILAFIFNSLFLARLVTNDLEIRQSRHIGQDVKVMKLDEDLAKL